MTASVGAAGVSIEVPRGWDARVRSTPPPEGTELRAAGSSAGVVLHAASFALPATIGDYGSGAVEAMTPGDVLLCLLEHDLTDADATLFRREGIPDVHPRDFRSDAMQRVIAGMAGAQWFFRVGGRAFCLYCVLGSHRSRAALAPRLATVVRSLTIT